MEHVRIPAWIPLTLGLILIAGCASGPQKPAKGTPGFYWQAAQETFGASDFLKTLDNLDHVAKTQNEHTAQAQAWRLVLLSGMVDGYAELADAYDIGARMNKANPVVFRNEASKLRTMASRLALRLIEAFPQWEKQAAPGTPVEIAFPAPKGSVQKHILLTKVSNGQMVTEAEIETLTKHAVERGVLLAVSRSLGNGEDAAKSREVLKTLPVQVKREVFLRAMADSLYDTADLYGRMKLDQPKYEKHLLLTALELFKSLPQDKQSKESIKKIEAALKDKRFASV